MPVREPPVQGADADPGTASDLLHRHLGTPLGEQRAGSVDDLLAVESSGLSCAAYAARAGINQRTLTWWKSKLASAGASEHAPVDFVEVTEQLAAPAVAEVGVIELVVGGVHVRVRGRVEAEALARVLDVLEARR
ncbi:IS66 family insertion sequence element accessory protein TnpA [Nannocystis exedens]|uniref:IS66 family insertion sequence element accessory protein TnpA n=1 Tax=Nannocystis exedens TaxID=54 RepID=UPI003B82FE9D